MARDGEAFERWLDEARIPQSKRTPHRVAILMAAFAFLQKAGRDYASRRLLTHFLLNCGLDLKVAQVARLVDVTRPTASRQGQLSTREVVHQIQHHMAGRPYGKLLPRFAGPIAHFLVTHPEASRQDVLDFVEATWGIRVGRTALYEYLKKYGLDRPSLDEARCSAPSPLVTDERALVEVLQDPPASDLPLARVSEDFFWATPSTPARSSCSRKCCAGGTSPSSVSPTSTGRYSGAF